MLFIYFLNALFTGRSTPTPPLVLPTSFNCDFETNMCGLTQARDDNFDWTRHKGATSSRGTGPSTDYTKVSYL